MRTRLQKLLASAGLASRREAERWIEAGRVSVNGSVASLGDSADPAHDDVRVDGQPLRSERPRYWLLHKPRGALTTTRDPHAGDRPTVLDLLPPAARRGRLFPVGRLDMDSEGLLLLTNDGEVTHALLHPSLGCDKAYRVTVSGRVTGDTARRLAQGILLDDGPMAPCRVGSLHWEARRRRSTFLLTLREGRKRQIRRALAKLGHPVVRLVRVRMGPLELGSLAEGKARPLTPREVRELQRFARGRESRSRAASAGGRGERGRPARTRAPGVGSKRATRPGKPRPRS